MKRIAIFASGAGSNAEKIIQYFKHSNHIKVQLIVCNNAKAGVLSIAAKNNISILQINKEVFFKGDAYIKELTEAKIDLVVLAGFLWKIPKKLVETFDNRIINIHPALLPKYGGKGMYGSFVHEAVIANKEKESGITIHFVNEKYDDGAIIFQEKCMLNDNDTPETLAKKIHVLEHTHFAIIIENICKEL